MSPIPNLKPVPGHPGIYASDSGEIWSDRGGKLRKLKSHPGGGRSWDSRGGYLRVTVRRRDRGNVPWPLYVHKAVCAAFHGPAPGFGYEVDHKDFDHTNNRPGNLCWKPGRENGNKSQVTSGYGGELTEEDLEEIFS